MTVSLLYGWLPVTAQVMTATALAAALVLRPRRWYQRWLTTGVLLGAAGPWLVSWAIEHEKWSTDPAPWLLWVWIGFTVLAVVVFVSGWSGAQWWQRVCTVVAVPMSLFCVALMVNMWGGYLPTVDAAWHRITGAPLGGQIDLATVHRMRSQGIVPATGTLVSVRIGHEASGFEHRDELVYLPPAWYASDIAPALPVVMMMAGEFNHPSDWPNVGVVKILDNFAAEHGGNAPIVVFVDHSGAFSNDTECVNGVRGSAADHLTKDVVQYVVSTFATADGPGQWGLAGWSTGGTCALMLAVKYPNLFGAFVDIDGEMGPNAGTRQQTLYRLFNGDEQAWAEFDPTTLITRQGHYQGLSGWFGVSENTPAVHRAGAGPGAVATVPPPSNIWDHAQVAQYMCELASAHGIDCSVVPWPGRHDFPSAASMFASALPWLAGTLGTPGVPEIPLPGS